MTAAKRGRDYLIHLGTEFKTPGTSMRSFVLDAEEMRVLEKAPDFKCPPSHFATASEAVCKREGWL